MYSLNPCIETDFKPQSGQFHGFGGASIIPSPLVAIQSSWSHRPVADGLEAIASDRPSLSGVDRGKHPIHDLIREN
jgi:hypothetical protein